MAKSKARFLAELLGSTGLVKKSKSELAGADEILDLDTLPTIPNSKLTNSSITINSSATSLGGSVTITTANVAENTNLYYTDARADARIAAADTGDLSEGSNLYYTNARADARVNLQTGSNLDLSSKDTGDLSEGSNLYYTNARADARIAAASTSDLSEGTNLYYTDARADARVALIVDSAPGTLNTLNELAAALGDDANFSTTVTNSIAAKLPLAGGTLTGALTVNSTNDNQILLTSPSSWTGIGFNDSAAGGTEYIWYNGTNGTFAIGGGGSNVANKKLHVDGGMTIGSSYDATAVDANSLNVQGTITSGAITSGAITSGAITSTSTISGTALGVTGTSNATGLGISLYSGASGGEPTYGLMFQGTGTFGTHGSVTADWATYFTMDSTAGRGWIFRDVTNGNVASISNSGNAAFNGTISSGDINTTGNIAINNSATYASFTLAGAQANGVSYALHNAIPGVANGGFSIRRAGSVNTLAFDTSDNATFAGTISSGAITSTGLTVNGNPVISGTSPQIFLQTTGASHYNWQMAAQESVSGAFEISSGGTDTSAPDDTYTPRLTIASNGNATFSGTISSGAITSSGNVSLNQADGFVYLNNQGTGNAGIYVRGITSSSTLRSHSTNNFRWEVTGSQKMELNSSGVLNAVGGYQVNGTTVIDASRNLNVVTGAVSGKFAVMSSSVHGSFDFYNNGTTYLNGAVTLDADTNISSGVLKIGGTTVIDASRNFTAASSIKVTSTPANNTPATDTNEVAGWGMIGNRSHFYVTNANTSGNVTIGTGGAHNVNAAAVFTTAQVNFGANRTLALNGTVIMDASRNLTNIGTISSGAITSTSIISSGLISQGTGQSHFFRGGTDVNWRIGSDIVADSGGLVNQASLQMIVGGTATTAYGFQLFGHSASTDPVFEVIPFGSAATSITNIRGNLYINNTAVIDNSRNLTNIGTISSGAITSTGNSSHGGYSSWTAGNGVAGIFMHYNATNSYRGYFDWRTLQLGNNGANNILAGDTTAGGYFKFWVNATAISQGGGTSGINALTLAATGNATFAGTISSGAITSSGSITASSFKDSDDATYYAEFANTTLSGKFARFVVIGDGTQGATNDGSWGARLNVTDGVHSKIEVNQDANSMRSHWYAHTGHDSIKFGTSTAHDVEIHRGGDTKIEAQVDGANITGNFKVGGTTVIDASRSLTNIAAVDSNLYLASNRALSSSTTGGTARILFPGNGSHAQGGSTATGAIKIVLPVGMTNTMVTIKGIVYEYATNRSFEFCVGGYNYPSGNTWANNPFGYITTSVLNSRTYNIRFGFDGSKACIYIGDTNSAWSYPQVSITECTAGYSNYGASSWDDGWDVSFGTPQNVTHTIYAADANSGHQRVLNFDAASFSVGGVEVINSSTNANFAQMSADYIGVDNTSNSTKQGIALYGGAGSANNPTYGLMFTGTAGSGTHGSVTGDWATYFTMNSTSNRGWIFRDQGTPTNVASISAAGAAYFNGELRSYSLYGNANVAGTGNAIYVPSGIYSTGTNWLYGTINMNGNTLNSGAIYATANITAYYSDERFKTKTRGIDNALEKVRSLSGFMYVENELAGSFGYTDKKEQVALSAQDVQKVLPEAVSLAPIDMETNEETGEVTSKSGENYLTVDYSRLVPLLVEAIKEQQKEIDELKSLVKQLIAN